MAVKLFVLGLPGSGKSTIARHITTYLKDRNWKSTQINDYVILQDMFLADTEHKQFKPTKYSGFNVIDPQVIDEALQRLEQEVNNNISSPIMQEKLILIEFARNDYLRAFQQFSQEFLMGACFLYLDVEREICKQRIRERTAQPRTKNDFFVSEDTFNDHYNEDNGRSLPQILERNYGIDKQRVALIDNNGSLLDSTAQINQFVDTICGLETSRGS